MASSGFFVAPKKGAARAFKAFKGRKRGLIQIEREVHSEVRRMVRGFGDVFLDSDAMLMKKSKAIGDIIKLFSPVTKNVRGSFKARGNAWKALKKAPGFSTTAVGKHFTFKTQERVNATDASQSRAIYSIKNVKVMKGTIHWPRHCSKKAGKLIPKLARRSKLAKAVKKTKKTAKKGLVEQNNNEDSILTEIGNNMGQVRELGTSGFLQVSSTNTGTGSCNNPDGSWDDRRNKNEFPDFSHSVFFPTAKSAQCASMKGEVQGKTYGSLRNLIDGAQKETEEAAVTVQDGIAKVIDLENKLTTVSRVCGFLDLPLNVLGFLPYVGPAFKVFRQVLNQFKNTIDSVNGRVKSINKQIADYKIDERMCTVRVNNDKFADLFRDLARNESKVVKPILEIDSRCGGFKAVQDVCTVLDSIHRPVNTALEHVKNAVNQIRDIAKWPVALMQKIDLILKNPVNIAMNNFFSTIEGLIQPFTNLLNRQISVSVPIPGIAHRHVCVPIHYPCGTKYCSKKVWRRKVRYPCGVNWCTRHQCSDVPYPTVTMTSFSFTVQQIITGVLSVLDLVMNALMSAIRGLIPGLPSLQIPIPGFDFPDLRIPSFPAFPNLPSIPVLAFNFNIHMPNMCSAVEGPLNSLYSATKNLGR